MTYCNAKLAGGGRRVHARACAAVIGRQYSSANDDGRQRCGNESDADARDDVSRVPTDAGGSNGLHGGVGVVCVVLSTDHQ